MSKDKLMFITMIQAIIYAVKYLREILLNRLIKGLYHLAILGLGSSSSFKSGKL